MQRSHRNSLLTVAPLFAPLLLVSRLAAQQTVLEVEGAAGDQVGSSIAASGDVNGDGYPDFVVGAVQGFVTDGSAAGYARLVSGRGGEILHEWRGVARHEEFGYAVAGVGDLDGDGFPDVAVGSRYDDAAGKGVGAVRVYSGQTGALLLETTGESALGEFGSSVAGLGDVDGDGTSDFAVGAPKGDALGADAGEVRVFSGASGALLFVYGGVASGDHFGHAVAGVGDVNDDGFADLAVGAPYAGQDGEGEVRVLSGRDGFTLFVFAGGARGDAFGQSVTPAGDVDGDGRPDLAVGAVGHDGSGSDLGAVFVFSGASGAELLRLEGAAPGGMFGAAVAAVGDVNRDGRTDLAVGAPRESANGIRSGVTYLFSGGDGALLESWLGEPGEGFGTALAGVGDLTGDGISELAVAAPGAEGRGSGSGLVRVLSTVGGLTPLDVAEFSTSSADPWSDDSYQEETVGDIRYASGQVYDSYAVAASAGYGDTTYVTNNYYYDDYSYESYRSWSWYWSWYCPWYYPSGYYAFWHPYGFYLGYGCGYGYPWGYGYGHYYNDRHYGHHGHHNRNRHNSGGNGNGNGDGGNGDGGPARAGLVARGGNSGGLTATGGGRGGLKPTPSVAYRQALDSGRTAFQGNRNTDSRSGRTVSRPGAVVVKAASLGTGQTGIRGGQGITPDRGSRGGGDLVDRSNQATPVIRGSADAARKGNGAGERRGRDSETTIARNRGSVGATPAIVRMQPSGTATRFGPDSSGREVTRGSAISRVPSTPTEAAARARSVQGRTESTRGTSSQRPSTSRQPSIRESSGIQGGSRTIIGTSGPMIRSTPSRSSSSPQTSRPSAPPSRAPSLGRSSAPSRGSSGSVGRSSGPSRGGSGGARSSNRRGG
ncbi:MAG TPA: VCBS repeat-containing protein [Planctomycetota bacterium]